MNVIIDSYDIAIATEAITLNSFPELCTIVPCIASYS